jgi:hypothetical protein
LCFSGYFQVAAVYCNYSKRKRAFSFLLFSSPYSGGRSGQAGPVRPLCFTGPEYYFKNVD